jgi:hypothetical protein
VLPAISIKDLFGNDFSSNVKESMKHSTDTAQHFLSKAGFIKKKHEAGMTNHSLASTYEGTVKVAETISKSMGVKPERTEETFFGENIKEAIGILKKTFKK